MEGLNAAFLNEMDKLLKKKKIIASVILSIIAVIVGQVCVTIIKGNFGLKIVGSSEFPIVVLSIFSYTILPLFTALVAIDMFSGEFSSNTMKITLGRPVSRFGVFSAKILCIAVFIMGNLIFVMVLSTLTGLIFNVSSGSVGAIFKIVICYITAFLPIFILSLYIVLLSNVLKGGLAVFFLSIITFIGLNFLGMVFARYSSFFITTMFDWYMLWISDYPSFFKIIRQFLIMSGCGIMFFAAGYYLFEGKDL